MTSPSNGGMGLRKTIPIVLLIALMFGATPFLFAGSVSATTTSTPTWQVGDKWALAGSKDAGVMYNSIDQTWLSSEYYSMAMANSTILSTKVNGTMDANIIFEVTAATATEYTLKVTYGARAYFSAEQTVSGDVPAAGHYYAIVWAPSADRILLADAPTVKKTMEGSLKLAAGVNGTAILTMQKSDMAITQVKLGASAYAKASASVSDFPDMQYGLDAYGSTVNVTYSSVALGVDAHAVVSAVATLADPVDLIPDGMTVDDMWAIGTTANVTGAVTGSIDVTGIPDTYKAAVSLFLAKYDIDGFPIDFATLSANNDSFSFSHGMFTTDVPVEGTLAYTKDRSVNDASGNPVTAMCIVDSETNQSYYVDPSNHHILAIESDVSAGDSDMAFTMHAVPVATAESGISDVQHQVSDRATADDIMSTTTTAKASDNTVIFVMVIIVAVVLILLVTLLYLRKKK